MTVDDKIAALAIAPEPEKMGDTQSFVLDVESQSGAKAEVDKFCLCIEGANCGPPPTKGWCGLEVEERPDFVWVKEDLYALILPGALAILVAICTIAWALYPKELNVLRPPPMGEFLLALPGGAGLVLLFYPLGIPAWYYGVSVAMTRKVTHVIFMTVLPASAVLSSHGEGLARDIFISATWQAFGTCFVLSFIWMIPCRKYIHCLKLSFAAIERSEDRPLALLFVNMQSTAMTMVQTPMIQWMLAEKKGLLIWIPFLSVALGDGLAEPVGRMYGKHKYEVYAIGTDKKYVRSYEGSATVFGFTLLAVLIALPQMNWLQAVLSILLIPAANTYAEAKSPHTFDNHIMFGITWLLLWLIFDVVPEV